MQIEQKKREHTHEFSSTFEGVLQYPNQNTPVL